MKNFALSSITTFSYSSSTTEKINIITSLSQQVVSLLDVKYMLQCKSFCLDVKIWVSLIIMVLCVCCNFPIKYDIK